MIENSAQIEDIKLISTIATPLLSFIAIVIYARALKNSRMQNEVLISQNLKPNFEKEIDGLLKDGNNLEYTIITDEKSSKKKILKLIETCQVLEYYLRKVTASGEFQSDRDNNQDVNEEYLKTRNYYQDLLQVRFMIHQFSSACNYYDNLERFIENIEKSRLINEDKYSIKSQLRRKVLEAEMKVYRERFKVLGFLEMKIPMYLPELGKTGWSKLKSTHLFNSLEKISNYLYNQSK